MKKQSNNITEPILFNKLTIGFSRVHGLVN